MGGEADQFHTTRWTLVMASAHDQSPAGQAALAALCQTYWYPLYAFARRRGHSPPDAQDLTQGFFMHVLENRALSEVDQLKGKFRSFLLACFQNYLSVEMQRAHRLKRGGQLPVCFPRPGSCREPLSTRTSRFFDARKDLRGPLGVDAFGGLDGGLAQSIRCPRERIRF